jgi:hypothetical protein
MSSIASRRASAPCAASTRPTGRCSIEFDEIVARYIDLDLSQYGAEAYYAKAGVESAEAFTDRLLSGARTA